MLLYSRKKVRYRRDGYCWKKRKDGKTTREDHMKLKVQGTEVRGSSALGVNTKVTRPHFLSIYIFNSYFTPATPPNRSVYTLRVVSFAAVPTLHHSWMSYVGKAYIFHHVIISSALLAPVRYGSRVRACFCAPWMAYAQYNRQRGFISPLCKSTMS